MVRHYYYEAYKKSRVAQGAMKDIYKHSVGLLETLDVFQRYALHDVHSGALSMNGSRCLGACESWLGWTVKFGT